MRFFDRLGVIASLFGQKGETPPEVQATIRKTAGLMAERWARARRMDPALLADVMTLGGILTAEPFEGGEVADLNTNRILYEKGRRDLALQISALMGVDHTEMAILMETNNAEHLG